MAKSYGRGRKFSLNPLFLDGWFAVRHMCTCTDGVTSQGRRRRLFIKYANEREITRAVAAYNTQGEGAERGAPGAIIPTSTLRVSTRCPNAHRRDARWLPSDATNERTHSDKRSHSSQVLIKSKGTDIPYKSISQLY